MPTRCFMIVFDVFLKELSSRTISGGGRRIAGRVGSLFFAAVSLMAWLASGFPSGLFPAVRDLFLPECFGRRDRRIFIITVYLCTEFQIFSLFFFQPDCCFIKLVLEFFYLIQCIIPLFFCFQGALFHLLELLFRFLLHFFKLQKHIFQYLEPVITDTYRFLMGIRRFFLQFQDPGSILPAFLLMKLFQPDISFSGFQFFISVCAAFRRHRSVIRS